MTIGFHDPFHDLIVIKGQLPDETHRQTKNHEKAHREWYLRHPTWTKIYNFLYWKPGLYFIVSAFLIGFYFFSLLPLPPSINSWIMLSRIAVPAVLCFMALYVFHYGLRQILEIPAKKAGRIVGLRGKEMLRLLLIEFIPAYFLLPTVIALDFLTLRDSLWVLGLGFLGVWLYQVVHIPLIMKLEKIGKRTEISS